MPPDTNTPIEAAGTATPPRPKPPHLRGRAMLAAALVAAGVAGAGATAIAERGHRVTFVALQPGPVSAMQDGSAVAVKGDVAEIFGNKFILADASGRALIETGRSGEGGTLVAKSETVTVQGRFEHGFVHAVAIQHGDGRAVTLDAPPPRPPLPPRGPLG
jgi:uncharacterized protein YdeI (BOF family)